MNDFDSLISTGRMALENAVAQGDDLMPIILVEAGDGTMIIVGLAGGHPFDVILSALPMLQDLRPRSMALTTDSYMLSGKLDEEADIVAVRARYGGSLAAAFKAGEPGVTEALCINIVTPTTADIVMVPYTRVAFPRIEVVWGEVSKPHAEVDGRMVDVLRAVWPL